MKQKIVYGFVGYLLGFIDFYDAKIAAVDSYQLEINAHVLFCHYAGFRPEQFAIFFKSGGAAFGPIRDVVRNGNTMLITTKAIYKTRCDYGDYLLFRRMGYGHIGSFEMAENR